MTPKQKVSSKGKVAELLRKSEQKLSSILASITDCHFELDRHWRFIRINDHSLAYFQRDREELIGKSYWEAFPTLTGSIFKEQYSRAVSKSTSVHFDVPSVLYPGRWVEVHAYPTEERGVSVFFRDITERKQMEEALRESEERFRAFMDNSPAIAWAKDEQGRVVYLNRAYEKRFGVRLEDWRGKTDFELWPQRIARTFRQSDLAVLRAGQTREMVDKVTDPDGTDSFWWNFKFPFQDSSGRRYVGGIGIDITERNKIEKQLTEYREHLENLVEERTKELTMKSLSLEEVNTALKVLLKQREQDKSELEDKILFNVRNLVLPYVDSLKKKRLDNEEKTYLDILETNLLNIISPFAKRLTSIREQFTPQEIKVANLIREGKTVKEIAAALGVSDNAINLHRQHVRNKLGLNNKKINLRTYLLSLP